MEVQRTARAASRPISHVRSLWGAYWPIPLIPAIYATVTAAIAGPRIELLLVAALVLALGYTNRSTQRALSIGWPVLLVVLGYDIFRYLQPFLVRPQTVLGCQMRALELTIFPAGPNTTWQDYFASHHAPFFDALFATPYAVFIFVVAGYAVYLSFVDEPRSRQFVWAVAITYLLAIAVWMAVPVAPPWYLRLHGCAINVSAPASAAGLLRADSLLGVHYFASIYTKSPAIFAAFPSMHCAFPVIALLVSWRAISWRTRPIHIVYAAAMFVGSVYLDHHWIIDGIAGWVIAAIGAYAAA